MNWLSSLFGGESQAHVKLSAEQSQAVADWKRQPEPSPNASHTETRYVVVDVEASGLSMAADRLISIGAVAVTNGRIDFNDAFSVVLRQEEASSTANILIHGIGGTAQRAGNEPAEALLAYLRYIGKSPLVAYHARFDQAMIDKATIEYLGFRTGQDWIDLAWVMPDVVRDQEYDESSLDHWLTLFGIENIQRHHAVSDAYATAQLLQVAIARGAQYGLARPVDFVKAEKARRYKHRAV